MRETSTRKTQGDPRAAAGHISCWKAIDCCCKMESLPRAAVVRWLFLHTAGFFMFNMAAGNYWRVTAKRSVGGPVDDKLMSKRANEMLLSVFNKLMTPMM